MPPLMTGFRYWKEELNLIERKLLLTRYKGRTVPVKLGVLLGAVLFFE